jgi:hypothetical protein
MIEKQLLITSVIEYIEEFAVGSTSCSTCLELMVTFMKRNLLSFPAKENIYNYMQLVNLMTHEMYDSPSYYKLSFTDEDNIDGEHTVFRACSVLLIRIESNYSVDNVAVAMAASQLDEYIEKMGHFPSEYIE